MQNFSVAEFIIVVDDHAAVSQAVRMDGHGPGSYLLRRLHKTAEEGQVRLLVLRVNEGEIRVPVEAEDADSGLFRRGRHGVQVLVRPVPELHELEAVFLRRLKPLQEGEFTVHRLDAG